MIENKHRAAGRPRKASADPKAALQKTNNPHTVQGVKYFTCPVCHKEFSTYLFSGWVYKKNTGKNNVLTFCGYTCMREAERILDKPKVLRGDKYDKG